MVEAERTGRFDEFVELTDTLLRTESVDHSGRYYDAKQVCIDPSGQARATILIAVAATGPRDMRTAARHADIWVTNGYSAHPGVIAPSVEPGLVKNQIGELSRICEAEGRDPLSVRKLVHHGQDRSILESAEIFADSVNRYREVGVTDLVVPFPHETEMSHADRDVLEEVADEVLSHLS